MLKTTRRSIAMVAMLALIISLIPSAAFGAAKTVKRVTGLEVQQLSNTSVELDWNYVNGAEGYKIYKSTSRTGKYTLVKTLKRGKTTNCTVKDLKLGSTYYFKMKAVDTVYGKKTLSGKFSNIVSVKMEQCVPTYTIEFPETLNADGSLTVAFTNKSESEVQIAASPIMFNDINDWSKDGVILKPVRYENITKGYTDTDEMDLPYIVMKDETIKVTYVINKDLQGIVSGLKGETAPTAISYKKGGEGFAINLMYKGWFTYMAIQYPDGQKLMTSDEYLQKVFDAAFPAE